jgi:hypothetical protein
MLCTMMPGTRHLLFAWRPTESIGESRKRLGGRHRSRNPSRRVGMDWGILAGREASEPPTSLEPCPRALPIDVQKDVGLEPCPSMCKRMSARSANTPNFVASMSAESAQSRRKRPRHVGEAQFSHLEPTVSEAAVGRRRDCPPQRQLRRGERGRWLQIDEAKETRLDGGEEANT